MKSNVLLLPLPTDDGVFQATYSDAGLAALSFPAGQPANDATAVPARVARWHEQTARAVRAVLAGKNPRSLPPLDLRVGTDFQRLIWKALQQIPAGRTVSYGELAQTAGRPQAARAVGGACGANPIPVLIPCHRVLAAGGGLGGFTAGLDWKRRLLAREGVPV